MLATIKERGHTFTYIIALGDIDVNRTSVNPSFNNSVFFIDIFQVLP